MQKKTPKAVVSVLVIAFSLGVAGCGDSAEENRQLVEDTVRETAESQGLPPEQVDCIVEETSNSISEEEYKADEPPSDLSQRVAEATRGCIEE